MDLPERQPYDGPIGVDRPCDGTIRISVSRTDRHPQEEVIEVSDYNAARVLVGLCLLLQVPLPKALNKLRMQ